jgi:hypothetical protein
MGFVNYLKSKKGIVDFGGILLLLLAGNSSDIYARTGKKSGA